MTDKKHVSESCLLKLSAWLIFILFMGMTLIPIPLKLEMAAIEIKMDDPAYFDNCTINIDGYYHFNILSNDRFYGNISVSGYELTSERMDTVYISKDGHSLYYHRFDEFSHDEYGHPLKLEYSLGRLVSGRFFRDMIIAVYSDNPIDKASGWKESGTWGTWNIQNGVCIITNAKTYAEGFQKVQKRME
ncbi:MAG: hypothetical protein HUJ80_00475 [Firmicutes bacterium]|nr:hypothetical protein [Bacillota bacterium]